jgi:hypothetical protein
MAKCSVGNEQIWVLQVPSAGLCAAADLLRDMQACCSLKVLLPNASLGAAHV